jgi:hypothetical protein
MTRVPASRAKIVNAEVLRCEHVRSISWAAADEDRELGGHLGSDWRSFRKGRLSSAICPVCDHR